MMKKILIIGSKGMLGQELAKVFKKDENYEIFAWDKEEIDITNEKDSRKKISELKPAIIINAAAYNLVDQCETDAKSFELAKKVNGKAPGYLAKIAKDLKAILVHYSTDYVFDGQPEIPEPSGCTHSCGSCGLHNDFKPQIGFDEQAKPNPISKYGKSKLLGEQEIQKNIDKFYLIRISKLFGLPGKSEISKKSFFEVMLEKGRYREKIHPVKSFFERSRISGKFNGVNVIDEETSCFTYAPDLAQKTKEIIESKKPFGIYHVVNCDPCTWYEAVLELYQQAKIKAKVSPVSSDEFPRPAKRPYYSVLINTKLNPLRSYKEALKDYLKKLK
jgi:dTDP-4-dehydrorhamnose reductase